MSDSADEKTQKMAAVLTTDGFVILGGSGSGKSEASARRGEEASKAGGNWEWRSLLLNEQTCVQSSLEVKR